jgi:hypothetical protein
MDFVFDNAINSRSTFMDHMPLRLILGLREVVWAFLATSERWEHACEHLDPRRS